MNPGTDWWVYVLVSETGRTYVGSTNNVSRRLKQHNGLLKGGAKCTRAWRPWKLGKVYGPYDGRSSAFRAEISLKRTKRGAGRLRWKQEESQHCINSELAQQCFDLVLINSN